MITMASGLTAIRTNPACGTCRKKCRKCDRTRPVCKRCLNKGLQCEGYPPRFQFFEYAPELKAKATGTATAPCIQDPEGMDVASKVSSHVVSSHSSDEYPSDTSAEPLASPSLTTLLERPSELDDILASDHAQKLLLHFDQTMCDALTIVSDDMQNPFRAYILPLAYQNIGVLHALLGLSSCHLHQSGVGGSQSNMTTALTHKVAAIQSLSSLLLKEEASGMNDLEEVVALALVLLLLLYDICESGISAHGAHLTGISFLCSRIAETGDEQRSDIKTFALAALTWLDVLRGFSGAEKLAYSADVRDFVHNAEDFSLETLVGCPVDIFRQIGIVLSVAKDYLAGTSPAAEFAQVLSDAERFFRGWNRDQSCYPTPDPEWKLLAEAYRHACILRVLRFPNTKAIPCEDQRIQQSVSAILDVCAKMRRGSTFYKRLLFPLFLAGADTSLAHQIHYVELCFHEIKRSTGFPHPAMTDLLNTVWTERNENTQGWANVPWMEFTCSTQLNRQHDYLFF